MKCKLEANCYNSPSYRQIVNDIICLHQAKITDPVPATNAFPTKQPSDTYFTPEKWERIAVYTVYKWNVHLLPITNWHTITRMPLLSWTPELNRVDVSQHAPEKAVHSHPGVHWYAQISSSWHSPSSSCLHVCVGKIFFMEDVGARLHTTIVFLKPLKVFTAGKSLLNFSF